MDQDWSALFSHPAFQSGVVPLAVAGLATGALRLRARDQAASSLPGLAVGIGLLASALLLIGLPTQPPFGATQKLVLLLGAGVLCGAVLELRAFSITARRALVIGLFLVASLWLAWPQLQREALSWPFALVVMTCVGLLYWLARAQRRTADDGVELILIASGIAGVAVLSGSLLMGQLAAALALATAGFLFWNWPRARVGVGPSLLLGAWLPAFLLAWMTVLLTAAPPRSLAPLVLVFVLAPAIRRVWPVQGRRSEAWSPLVLLILGSIPVVLAFVMAMLVESSDDLYYR
jgi:hypothetical protein